MRAALTTLLGFVWVCAFIGAAYGMLGAANSLDKYAAAGAVLGILMVGLIVGAIAFTGWEEKK